jgi:hypothetical protein
MRGVVLGLIGFVVVCLFAYLCGAFLSASFDVSEWSIKLRGFILFCAVTAGFTAFMTIWSYDESY